MIKPCKVCGNKFNALASHVTCSPSCREENRLNGLREYNKKMRVEHPEKVRSYHNEWQNRPSNKEKKREWRRQNADAIRLRALVYRRKRNDILAAVKALNLI